MNVSLTYLPPAVTASASAALRVRMPVQEGSTPTHIVALIDASDSMQDLNKLTHVKHCMSLLLRILSPEDRISVVTFGDQADTLLQNVPTDAAHTAAISSAIQQIHTNGCTNLSDGIIVVQRLLEAVPEADRSRKTLLLLLTDGHANRGVTVPDTLLQMLQRLQESFTSLSVTAIAYGTDHNTTLLRSLAERSQGAYSVVKCLEDAALTIGDAVGGAMSCVAQNVVVTVPAGTVVHGPYTVTAQNTVALGDGYGGAETLLLLDLPATDAESQIRVTATLVPSLENVSVAVSTVERTDQPDPVIDLTRIRYEIAAMFLELRAWTAQTSPSERDTLLNRVHDMRDRVRAERFEGNVMVSMLEMEIGSLITAIQRLQVERAPSDDMATMLTQHAAFTSLARGTTRAISPHRAHFTSGLGAAGGARFGRARAASDSSEENPQAPAPRGAPRGAGLSATSSVLSPSGTARQQQMANTLRAMSSQAPDDVHANEN